MPSKSLMELSLRYLSDLGYEKRKVEKWNPFARVRQDHFGCADIEAFHEERATGVLWVQVCSSRDLADHLRKIHNLLNEERPLRRFLLSKNRYQLWCYWADKGNLRRIFELTMPNESSPGRWTLREEIDCSRICEMNWEGMFEWNRTNAEK